MEGTSTKPEEERNIDSDYYRIGGDPLYVDANKLAHEIHGDLILGSKDKGSTVRVQGKLELPNLSSLRIGSLANNNEGSESNSSAGEIVVVGADGSLSKIKASAPGQIPIVGSDGSLSFADAGQVFQPIAQKSLEEQAGLGIYRTYGMYVRKKGDAVLEPGSQQDIKGWSIEDSPSSSEFSDGNPPSPGSSLFYVLEDAAFDFETGSYTVQEDGPYEIEINVEVESKSSAGSVTLYLLVDGQIKREMLRQFNSNPRYPTMVHMSVKPRLTKGRVLSVAAYVEGPAASKVVVLPTTNTTWVVRRLAKD